MGVHEAWSQPGGLLLNGLLPKETGNVTRVLDAERWSMVEERIAELIVCIQPNRSSDEHRNAVAKYVKQLIMNCCSCEVFLFGSVPLKTYLPDGDIDLTAFSPSEDLKYTWANAVLKVLENERKSGNGEFRVKEVHYIPAEVKIIKCLVENIVVDISFSQVGGLCTLCFLEEVDNLISQNHLFKRSIILIKAWCYYESRTLGAYHGLISTYTLEILVLYIFHAFSNMFAGPFEVLYRFLEFFSHFDWDNFCVSIWGPVPISSLPDMTAELPRKDGGKLLFDRLFLEACSTVYSVSLDSQEGQCQQFVSKYFNVIDPLRTNNNLGRSVNKANFHRIRSAFAFGATKLANLLVCSKENLIEEADQFFMNTWERHRGGHRPDAPASNIHYLQLSVNCPNEGPKNSRGITSLKKEGGNIELQVSHDHQAGGGHVYDNSTKQAQHAYRKANAIDANSRDVTLETKSTSNISTPSEMNQRNSRPDHSVSNNKGISRFQFSRTKSSPELTGTYAKALPQTKHNRIEETSTTHNEHVILSKHSSREVIESHSAPSASFSFDDPNSLKQSLSHESLEVTTDSRMFSNSYLNDSGSTTMKAGLAFDSGAMEWQLQKEQDQVNMVASSGNHDLSDQVQLPKHLASHLSLPLSPVQASTCSAERNLKGSCRSQGLGSSMPPYICLDASQNSYAEEAVSFNENSSKTCPEAESENEELQIHYDGKLHSTATSYSSIPTSRGNVSETRGNHKAAAESRGHRGDYPDAFRYRSGRTNVVTSTGRNANLRYVPKTHSSSYRRKTSLDTTSNAQNSREAKTTRVKWGRKPSLSESGKPMSGRQLEGESEHTSSRVDDENRDCFPPFSIADTHSEDNALEFVPLASPHARKQPATSIEPVVVGSSRQKVVDNSADGANSDGSINQFDEDNGEQNCRSPSHQDIDIAHNYNHSEAHMNPVDLNSTRASAPDSSEVLETDILNSDFASHWQNLQYGRLCQNTQNYGPHVYSPFVMVPPVYLQGHYPQDGSVRPTTDNINFLNQIMVYDPWLVPVTPQQPVTSRPSGGYDRYKNDRPTFRGGTGTYIPNPKPFLRDRHFPSRRNHRGGYNYNRSDRKDTDGSWKNSK